MRILLLLLLAAMATFTAQAQWLPLWQHRFPAPDFLTGFGDVGTGLDLRNDSLLVGHSWMNISTTTLMNAATGQILWSESAGDTVFHQGGRAFFGGAIVGSERVSAANGIDVRTRLQMLDGTLLWGLGGGLSDVQFMAGPLVDAAADTACALAYAGNVLHGFRYDHSGAAGAWQYPQPLPWTGFNACLANNALLLTAMVDHPNSFSDVPRLMRLDPATGALLWAHWLCDTTAFLMNAPAITVPWQGDTVLTAFTTYAGNVELRLTSGADGSVPWSFTDALGFTPYLASVAAVPATGRIYLALDNGTVIAYAATGGRQWLDTLYTAAPYKAAMVLANQNRVVGISAQHQGLPQGQDIHLRTLDPQNGAVLAQAWVNDTVNTHDLLENALLHQDRLYLLTAATYDTVNILDEGTTLLLNAFDLSSFSSMVEINRPTEKSRAVVTDGSILSLMDAAVSRWALFDGQGRLVADGSRVEMDATYARVPAGRYLLWGRGGIQRLLVRP